MNLLSSGRLRLFFILLTLLVLFPIAPQAMHAQSSPPTHKAPPPPPPPPATPQKQFVSYWTSETGWTSELQLRNNAANQDLTVTPVLRLADGAETSLAPVTIKSQEVTSVDIGAAIVAAPAPQLLGTYGSVALHFVSPSSGTLYAAMMIRRTGHPVAFHIDATGELPDRQAGSREGIWWLPKATTSDYLVLTNQGETDLALTLSLYDVNGRENKQAVILGPSQTNRLSVRKLVQVAGLTGSYGGIEVSTTSHAGSLDTLQFLFDEAAGFSAILKMFDYDPQTKLQERDYAKTGVWTTRAPMLALANPDPALAFPPGTTLRPELFIRNTTAKPIDVTLRFSWRMASTTGKATGPPLHLLPYETRLVNVVALQDGTILPKQANWTSVTITTNSKPNEVMAVAASYDETLKYGAQTPFSDQLSFKWEGGMWEYDPYHSSIITAGNGGTKPAQAGFTIFYNQGTQRYDLEQTLKPDEQMWIDVGKLIREHTPDKNGRVLPTDLNSGSYEIRDLTNKFIGTLFEGKVIYDKTYGHATYGCGSCCGYVGTELWYNPLGVPLSSTSGQGVYGHDKCGGLWEDISDAFYSNWSTTNFNIATVDYYGTHTGMSIGSTTSSTSGQFQGWLRLNDCPIVGSAPSGGVNVMPHIDSISPDTVIVGSNNVQLTINGGGFGSSPTVNLPAGVTAPNGQGSTNSRIIITVNVSINATIGANSITVTANGQTSNKGSFTLDGPFYMVVQADRMGVCNGCSSAVERFVTYQVMNFSGSVVGTIPIGESYTPASGWNCNQSQPTVSTAPCSQGFTTRSDGTFIDGWSIAADGYTPPGCGETGNNVDHWTWCATSPPRSVGKLTGWVHTNAVSINGYVNPPNAMPTGLVINP